MLLDKQNIVYTLIECIPLEMRMNVTITLITAHSYILELECREEQPPGHVN